MNRVHTFAGIGAFILLALPVLASAQSYYPSNMYGASSYIPSYAMQYVNYGYQMQQQSQQQYQSYSYPTYTQQYSYPSTNYGYTAPTNSYYSQSSSYYQAPNYYQQGLYASEPQSYSYPSGTYGPFNTQLCYWSDYPTYAPCGKDPQQWIQDPYTGTWY